MVQFFQGLSTVFDPFFALKEYPSEKGYCFSAPLKKGYCFQPFYAPKQYSLFQKKRTFNPDFFRGPPGGGGPKIHMVDYVNDSYTNAQLFSFTM